MSRINFFSEDIDFTPQHQKQLKDWIKSVIIKEGYTLEEVNYIFCSDDYLLNINQNYLDHDTYTDIITFDNSEAERQIEGDIFISIDRVKENANQLNTKETDELHRVMIHGILHLLGHGDSTSEEKTAMRKKEEACLSLRNI